MGALVVQWIERLTPNESIEVRFLARAQMMRATIGGVAEWSKAHDSKSCRDESPSRVQISPPPL